MPEILLTHTDMFKRRVYFLCFCFVGGILMITTLFFFSKSSIKVSSGFVRNLPSHFIKGINFIDIKYNSWYFAGNDEKYIFLANTVAPNLVLQVDFNLNDTSQKNIKAPDTMKVFNGATLQIIPPLFFLQDGVKPSSWNGNLSEWILKSSNSTPFFTASVVLSPKSMIFRSVINRTNVLVKQNGSIIKPFNNLLQKQVDGIFCTDGTLIKAVDTALIFYTYHYRNQFLCMDTNLNLRYRANTIDTVSKANVKVTSIKSESKLTLAYPPLKVNGRTCATRNWFFVQSDRKADNEIEDVLKLNTVLDVYTVKDGKYQFSIYLPNFKGHKIKDFKVIKNTLFAIYDHFLYKYQLNF